MLRHFVVSLFRSLLELSVGQQGQVFQLETIIETKSKQRNKESQSDFLGAQNIIFEPWN